MIYDSFRVTGTDEFILDFSDMVNATLRGDDIRGFDSRRDEVLLSIKKTPHDHIPESVYNMRIWESEKLKAALALYDQDLEHKEKLPSYARLTEMVKKIFELKIRCRSFKARNDRTARGAPANKEAMEKPQVVMDNKEIVTCV